MQFGTLLFFAFSFLCGALGTALAFYPNILEYKEMLQTRTQKFDKHVEDALQITRS